MAGVKRRKSISILGGTATLNPPSPSRNTWTVNYRDHEGRPRSTSGGSSREEAEMKARVKLGWATDTNSTQLRTLTLSEAFEKWIDQHREKWNPRTLANYEYVGKSFLETLGNHTLSSLTPTDIGTINLAHLSRGQQKKVRSLLRGVLNDNPQSLLHDSEKLAKAVKLTTTASANRREAVDRGDIPTTNFVNSVIMTCYSTLQESPFGKLENPPEWKTQPHHFSDGLPEEVINLRRRGIPNHYSNVEQRRADEDVELASIYRRVALATALGASGGMRIGEILALRPRHFLSYEDLDIELLSLGTDTDPDRPLFINYTGTLPITEQASQSSDGKIWLTAPKGRAGGKSRTVHLPALLPAGWGSDYVFGKQTVRQQISQHFPRFNDTSVSLWNITRNEAITLWKQGYPPMALILWDRLHELWNSPAVQMHNSERKRYETFSNLLIFPTRNPARKGRDGNASVRFEANAPDTRIVEGTGTYLATTNFARDFTNPVYDYVGEEMGSYPTHRVNALTRRGWTFHGLRHYAITSWLNSPANIPLTVIAEQAGHEDISFTLRRYAHAVGDRKTPAAGFEI